jgi:membrane fusion protein, multidrug efflux system
MKSIKLYMLLAMALLASCSNEQPQQSGERVIPVAMAEAEMRDLSLHRTVTAPVVAYLRIYVNAMTEGQLLDVLFEEGDFVKEGDLLARIDTRRQEAQLRMAEATLLEIQHRYQRTKKLFEEQVIPKADYEMAERQLAEAEASVRMWRVEVGFGEIRAPIDAVVAAKLVESGNTISLNQRLYTIEDHSLLVTRPALSEMDIVNLEKGQQLNVSFDVFPDLVFQGKIRRIYPAADAITRLFTVEVEVDQTQSPEKIRPGYLARMHFTTDHRSNVVAVMPESLVYRDNKAFVFIIDDGRVKQQEVETGIRRDGWIEIRSGLVAGQQIAAGNIDILTDGARIDVRGNFRRYGFAE